MSDATPLVTPEPSDRVPALISDGGGLPFEPDTLFESFEPLDPGDPPVKVLLEQIELGRQRAQPRRLFRSPAAPTPIDDATKLQGWRVLASREDEILFGRGRPPQLLTVAVERDRKGRWRVMGVSSARPLRACRDGVRASSWRIDPDHQPPPDATEVRVLITEQTQATGRLAADRLLTPELYMDEDEIVLRFYVKPLGGYQNRTRRWETPVTVRLPEAVGARRLVDGALYEA